MTIKEMLEKRAKLIEQARAIYTKAEQEKREPAAQERQEFDRLMAESDALKQDADNKARLETSEKEIEISRGAQIGLQQQTQPAAVPEKMTVKLRPSICGDLRNIEILQTPHRRQYREAFNRYLVEGPNGLMGLERQALQKDSDTAGGYLSAPEQFQAELIMALDDLVFMRQIGRVLPAIETAESLGAPSLDADPADPTWVAELVIGGEDSTMAFGKRSLTPHPLAQYIKVSKTLLRRSAIGVDAIVRQRLAYKIGVIEENAFLNGNGAQQPLGVFTASNDGISTGRDVSTGNTTTSIQTDGLIEAVFALKAQYRRRNCAWIFHRDAVKQIRKLKDGEGRYIWQASLVAGTPDTILTYPVNESEYAPHTFTTGLYVGILGDFQYYWIVDALTMTIQVLLELYAATNQNGYLSRIEADGMPVHENAFARVKLA